MRTGTGRIRSLAIGALLFCALPLSYAASASPTSAALTGQVLDTLGRVVEGVEVLVADGRSQSAFPLAAATSDAAGRFVLRDLDPGQYRIAATKVGYRTFIGRVDTLVRRSIDLVLAPEPADRVLHPATTDDPSWALRLPRRSLLRELDPARHVVDADASLAEGGAGDDLRVQLDQLFSFPVALEGSERSTELEASDTRMALASPVGGRGSVLVQGGRERSSGSTGALEPEVGPAASENASRVRVGLDYATGSDAQLEVLAHWSRDGYRLSGAPAETGADPAALDREQRSWGYDASWSRRLARADRIDLAVNYLDRLVARDGDGSVPGPVGWPDEDLIHRSSRAEGSYRREQGASHALEVSVRAQHLRWPESAAAVVAGVTLASGIVGPAAALAPDASSASSLGGALPTLSTLSTSRWSLEIEARDAWTLVGPLQLLGGLGYRQDGGASETSLVVPRIGGAWRTPAGLCLEGLVSYHADATGRTPAEGQASFDGGLGYEAALAIPVTRGFSVEGGTSYEPVHFGGVRGSGDPADADPFYVTDGRATVHEHRLSLVGRTVETRTSLDVSRGEASGPMAVLLPWDVPLQVLADRRLRYSQAALGVRLPDYGTDLRVEYRKVALDRHDPQDPQDAHDLHDPQDPQFDFTGTESTQRWLELSLRQDLWQLPSGGDWRLLMALRFGSVDSEELERWLGNSAEEPLDALNRRLSAGVSVMF